MELTLCYSFSFLTVDDGSDTGGIRVASKSQGACRGLEQRGEGIRDKSRRGRWECIYVGGALVDALHHVQVGRPSNLAQDHFRAVKLQAITSTTTIPSPSPSTSTSPSPSPSPSSPVSSEPQHRSRSSCTAPGTRRKVASSTKRQSLLSRAGSEEGSCRCDASLDATLPPT